MKPESRVLDSVPGSFDLCDYWVHVTRLSREGYTVGVAQAIGELLGVCLRRTQQTKTNTIDN